MADGPIHISSAIPFEFELVAVPGDLTDLVNTFFVARADDGDIDEMLPAYSAQLMVYVEGRSDLRPEGGEVFQSDRVTCTAPLLSAAPFTLKGPATIVGASLTPLGWHCLAQLPADKVNNCVVPAARVLAEDEIVLLEQLADACRSGSSEPQAIVDAISEALRSRAARLDPGHVRFVKQVIGWLSSALNPSLETLYSDLSVSKRTAQRLCRRYFGVSPSHLVKRYRAIRAAMLLANRDLPDAMRDEIVSAYFDQAHLIRDIRRYTGRTPGALRGDSLVQDTLDPDAHGAAARILR
ncbi:helix-turn-helix transcriptional regulator [Erythrobacter sp. GH1-10]|uniref:helix-turn-helix transcriptional regulator n=1 Tax=Erythrobacter sp. GH1-10 TaxID=3349334 RepID=UPI003877E560